ncbi:hypothetical protein HDU80_009606, partial [Chytriomyces hyalinus]
MVRRSMGKKGNSYVCILGSDARDVAAIDAGRKWEGAGVTKAFVESQLILPKMLRDILWEVGLDIERIRKDWASFLPLNKWLIDLQADQGREQTILVISQPRAYDGECRRLLKDILGSECVVSQKKLADSINCRIVLAVLQRLDTSNLKSSRLSVQDRSRIFSEAQGGVARIRGEIDAGEHFRATYRPSNYIKSFSLLPVKDSNCQFVGLNSQILCDILRGYGFDAVSIIGERTFPVNKPRYDICVKIWKFAFDFKKLPPMVPQVPLPGQMEVYSHSPFDALPHLRKSIELSQVSPDDDVDAIDPGVTTIATGVNLRDLQGPQARRRCKNKIHCGLGSQ